ncbi:NUDIX hydrolase [Thalassoglobus sp. JC818]|uniref:NUDIX hydrolase n=1 Tax=Thalassoglobus sp. JC818 TaxID=3232136 RepID=UPI00345A9DC9
MPRQRTEELFAGKHLKLVKQGKWEFAERVNARGVVAIIAVTTDDCLVLTEQYRPPVQKKVVDLPAGLAGDIPGQEQEQFEQAARRELLEETGFQGEKFEFLLRSPSSAGMTSEVVDFYLTRDVVQVEAGGGDESEDIKVHVIPMGRIARWLQRKQTSRTMVDQKVYGALGLLAMQESENK